MNFTNDKEFDIKQALIPFNTNVGKGKYRPAIVLKHGPYFSKVLAVTSEGTKKSSYVSSHMYAIKDWRDKKLLKPSWIDLNRIVTLPNNNFVPITVTRPYKPLSKRQSYYVAIDLVDSQRDIATHKDSSIDPNTITFKSLIDSDISGATKEKDISIQYQPLQQHHHHMPSNDSVLKAFE